MRVEVTRESLAERGRLKLAQAVYSEGDLRPAPSLAEQIASDGDSVRIKIINEGNDTPESHEFIVTEDNAILMSANLIFCGAAER